MEYGYFRFFNLVFSFFDGSKTRTEQEALKHFKQPKRSAHGFDKWSTIKIFSFEYIREWSKSKGNVLEESGTCGWRGLLHPRNLQGKVFYVNKSAKKTTVL